MTFSKVFSSCTAEPLIIKPCLNLMKEELIYFISCNQLYDRRHTQDFLKTSELNHVNLNFSRYIKLYTGADLLLVNRDSNAQNKAMYARHNRKTRLCMQDNKKI